MMVARSAAASSVVPVKSLKRQAEVIDEMIRHMALQTAEVQQAVRDELEEVEAVREAM